MLRDAITDGLITVLETEGQFDVMPYAYDLASEARVKELARRINVKPSVLVNVGEPVASAVMDSTGRVTRDEIPLEVIVAHVNRRSVDIQRSECGRHAWTVRTLLQGLQFESENFARGACTFVRTEHVGTTDGLTIYSVYFTLSGLVSADA